MTEIAKNSKCPCGSGKKYKKCCMIREAEGGLIIPKEKPVLPGEKEESFDISQLQAQDAPLLEGVPNIFIATPWSNSQVSAGFTTSVVNMAMAMPFPARFGFYKSRHTADARNIICMDAIQLNFSHIMMIDADQRFPDDLFLRLWKVLEEYGHDNTIASGWATIRGGILEGNTSVIFRAKEGYVSAYEDSLPKEVFQTYSMGTPGLLFSTAVLTKIQPPWFADLLVIDTALETIKERDGGEAVIYWPTERIMTHDFTFGIRMSEAGVKIMVDPACKLPHEVVETI
jgi:hypothetical protein